MFGNDRFSFETPNVIDPGDMPPSRPNRERDNKSSNVPNNANISTIEEGQSGDRQSNNNSVDSVQEYNQVRESAARLLRDIADLDLPPPSTAPAPYDPYDEDDIPDRSESFRGLPKQGFNKEKLHLYATSLMKTEAQPLAMGRTVKLQETRSKSKHRVRNRFCPYWRQILKASKIIFGIALFIGIVIACMEAFKTMKAEKSTNESTDIDSNQQQGSSVRFQKLILALSEGGISSLNDLKTPGTPQFKAANWIANVDGEQRNITDVLTVSSDSERIIQRYTLAVFYYATGGHVQWQDNLGFVTAAHECAWFDQRAMPQFAEQQYALGVGCDNDLFVNSLFIPDNGLEGTIPTEIRFLNKLNLLSLRGNAIQGNIPEALRDMKNLMYLDLNYNELEGAIPSFIGDFPKLQILGLSNNKLIGEVPNSLGTLGTLKTLWLDNNPLSGDISLVRRLSALEYLYIDHSGFTGQLNASFFESMKHLRIFDVSDNFLDGEVDLGEIFNHPYLKVVDLANNSFVGKFPESIDENTNLEYFSLRGNAFDGSLPSNIGALSKLTHLDLLDNKFSGDLPNSLGRIFSLNFLFLGKNSFSPDLPPLSQLIDLRELSLTGLQLDQIPSWIKFLKNLQLLDLSHNDIIGVISTGIWNLRNLQYLILNDNEFSGAIPKTDIGGKALKFLAVQHNLLSGDADHVCADAKNLTSIATDCTLDCSTKCCRSCCKKGDNICFKDDIDEFMLSTEGEWELKYSRSGESLDPSMLEDAAVDQITDSSSGFP